MADDIAKQFFNKIQNNFEKISDEDNFAKLFLQSIKSGENKLYQKHLSETKVFDSSWVEKITEYLPYINSIVRDPRSFIKNEENIVPVERAKKVTAESVRHLASHTQYIKSVENGNVVPNKILTIHREEDKAIYENRFVKTLIQKLTLFVERRFDSIKSMVGTQYSNRLRTVSEFVYDGAEVEYEINMTIKKQIKDVELEKPNDQLLEKLHKLRESIFGFALSPFMKELKEAKPVFPPIQQTNIIMKDHNYHACYDLWVYLDSYDKLDYSVNLYEREINFSEEYINNIYNSILMGFSTIISNDKSNLGEVKSLPKIVKQEKKAKILKSLIGEENKPTGDQVEIEKSNFNEYYFQEAKKLYSKQVNKMISEGEPLPAAVEDVVQVSNKLTEGILKDLLKVPNKVKNNTVKLRYQLRKKKVIDQIISHKKKDVKKMEKEKERLKKQITKSKQLIKEEKAKENEKIKNQHIEELMDPQLLRNLDPNSPVDVDVKEILAKSIEKKDSKKVSKPKPTKDNKAENKKNDSVVEVANNLKDQNIPAVKTKLVDEENKHIDNDKVTHKVVSKVIVYDDIYYDEFEKNGDMRAMQLMLDSF